MLDHLYLAHHGIKGMKWGVRRFQNSDGSLTSAGKERYGSKSWRAPDTFHPTVGQQRRAEQRAAKAQYKKTRAEAKQAYKDTKEQINSKASQRTKESLSRYENAANSYTATRGERIANALLLDKDHRIAYNAMRSQNVSRGAAYASILLTGSHGAKSIFEQQVVAESKKKPIANTTPKPSIASSKTKAQHIIEDRVTIDEVRRSRGSSEVKKHVSFDKGGKVTGISKELESFIGTSRSNLGDDDLVYQAMVLEALKKYK